jgi:hypothetical protein
VVLPLALAAQRTPVPVPVFFKETTEIIRVVYLAEPHTGVSK